MKKKDLAAARLGRKGGKALAKKMTKAERSEACRWAAEARWAKVWEQRLKIMAKKAADAKRAKVKGQLKSSQESQKDNCK